MRHEDDVVERHEFVRHIRLLLENVETGTSDRTGLQRLDQRLFIDDGATGDVEDDAHGAKRFEDFGSDEITRLLPSGAGRSEEHTSELQSLMRISSAVFC